MAKSGIDHSNASVSFQIIELARDLKEYEHESRKSILAILYDRYGLVVSINTLDDWLYYRTRVTF